MPNCNIRKNGTARFGIRIPAIILVLLSLSFPVLAASTTNFTVSSPANGATVSGTITIAGAAGSKWVNVHAYTTNWVSLSADVAPSNGSYNKLYVNTAQLVNGTHSINIVAFSVPAGQSGGTSATIALSLNVQNAAAKAATSTAASPVNGACGSSSGATLSSAPTTNLCGAGLASSVSGSGPWTWSCAGSNGGSTASCSAQSSSASVASSTFTASCPTCGATVSGTRPIVGAAGSKWVNVHAYTASWASLSGDVVPSNGAYSLSLNTAPLANGTASINIVAFSVPAGQSGGTSSTVTLSLNIQNAVVSSNTPSAGVCGSMNGATTNAAPTSASGKCSVGSASAMSGSGNGPFTWSCAGSNGGTTMQCSTIAPSSCGTAPIGSSYQLVFDDEFNGTSLDTTKWSTGWFGSGITSNPNPSVEEECYDPAQVTVNNGLNLTAIAKKESCGVTNPLYASGMITTNGKFQFAYGYFEALIYLPPSGTEIANWPAFWADGTGTWPATGEMDVMEGLSGQACSHFHDPSGGPGFCATGNYSGWHIYAGWWTPGAVNYYYDNVLVGTVTQGITSAPMYLILNNAMSPVNNYGGPTVDPADMQVKWVHVYSNTSGAAAVTPEAGYAGPGGSTTCN